MLCVSPAVAQTPPSGLSSSATEIVSVSTELGERAPLVQISGLFDLDFGTFTPGGQNGPLDRSFSPCLYHTSPTFSLTIAGPNPNQWPPALVGPNNSTVALRQIAVRTDNATNNFSGFLGPTLFGLTSNQIDPTCFNGPRAQINFQLAQPPQGAPTGVYSTTLSLIMAVE